jgi:anti-repressor protein
MNQLSQINKTMSSLEIAELTGKQHSHVKRDIEEQLGKLEGGVSKFGRTYVNPQNNQSYPIYELPKRETLILVSGYSVELRTKIIDRWDELERKNSAPKSFEQQTLEVIQGLVARVEEMKPKAEFYNQVIDAQGDRIIMDAAKLLKFEKPRKFYELLRNDGVLMKDNLPYQQYISQGYFRVNLGEKNGHAYSTAYVTNKGLAWLQKKYDTNEQKGLTK